LAPDVLKEDDPQIISITNAITQVAAVLKDEFSPYLPGIMEKLIKDSQVEVDFKLEDADLPQLGESDENLTSVTFKMKGFDGSKKLSLNTYALEQKINSVQVIRALAQNLGEAFFDFVEPTLEALSPIFEYKYSRAVRLSALETCQYLIKDCKELSQKEAVMRQLWVCFAKGIDCFVKKKDTIDIVAFLKEFYHCMKIFTDSSVMPIDDIADMTKLLAEACVLAAEDK
jgi:hypothetical protein